MNTVEEVLKVANEAAKETGKSVETVLVEAVKGWAESIKLNRSVYRELRITNKALSVELGVLKIRRLESDRNGGGKRTSILTSKINSGRNVVNNNTSFMANLKEDFGALIANRNLVVAALRKYYKDLVSQD